MSIKLLARDLYRCQQEIDRLKQELNTVPDQKRAPIEQALRKAVAGKEFLQRALDGHIGR